MFGVSFSELLVIMGAILIFLGPEKLPDAAITLGKIMGQLKRQSDAIRKEFYNSVYKPADDLKREVKLSAIELSQVIEEPQKNKDPLCPDSVSKANSPQVDTNPLNANNPPEASIKQDKTES